MTWKFRRIENRSLAEFANPTFVRILSFNCFKNITTSSDKALSAILFQALLPLSARFQALLSSTASVALLLEEIIKLIKSSTPITATPHHLTILWATMLYQTMLYLIMVNSTI